MDENIESSCSHEGRKDRETEELDHAIEGDPFPSGFPKDQNPSRNKPEGKDGPVCINGESAQLKKDGTHNFKTKDEGLGMRDLPTPKP
jgi:hypothetical protein